MLVLADIAVVIQSHIGDCFNQTLGVSMKVSTEDKRNTLYPKTNFHNSRLSYNSLVR